MNCKNCGEPLSANEKFCGNCGARSGLQDTVKCSNCGKEFIKDFGICPECGNLYEDEAFSEAEDGGIEELLPIDLNEDPTLSQIPSAKNDAEKKKFREEKVSDKTPEFNSKQSTEEQKDNTIKEGTASVRTAMFEYIKTKPYAGFLQISAVLLLVYPIMLLLSFILNDTGFSSTFNKSEFLLKLISFFGIFLCLARKQSDALSLSAGIMAVCYIVRAAQSSFTFNLAVKIFFYSIVCVALVREFMTADEQKPVYKKSSETGGGDSQLKWIVIGILIAVGIVGIMLLCSGKVCDYCGKFVFEYSEVLGKTVCKDCFFS